jgi:hypothetical protein
VWTPTVWYALALGAAIIALAAMGFGAGLPAPMPVMGALALLGGAAAAVLQEAACVVMVLTSPAEDRGAAAGWVNAGQLGGGGIGGGAALWIAASWPDGIALAGLVMALASAPCIAPLLWLRPSRGLRGEGLGSRVAGVGRTVIGLLRTRVGILVALFSLAPTGLNEAAMRRRAPWPWCRAC